MRVERQAGRVCSCVYVVVRDVVLSYLNDGYQTGSRSDEYVRRVAQQLAVLRSGVRDEEVLAQPRLDDELKSLTVALAPDHQELVAEVPVGGGCDRDGC